MSRFLSLPREIRDRIIYFVVYSHEPAPADQHCDAAIPARKQAKDISSESWMHSVREAYQIAMPDPASSSLLRVCRQLHAETSALLQLHGSTLALDVMFVEERELWPTWLCVPRATERVEALDVTIRIVGTVACESDERSQSPNIWQRGDDAGPGLTWILWGLVGACGDRSVIDPIPQPEDQRTDQEKASCMDRKITFKKLILSFESCADESRLAAPEDLLDWFRARRDYAQCENTNLRDKVMRPEWLAEHVAKDISKLLLYSAETLQYGALLYERLGEIVMMIDGVEIKHYRLDEGLATVKLDIDHPFTDETSTERFKRWKLECMRIRKMVGLPVPPIVHKC